jgi:uncharacterized caspase-like protein
MEAFASESATADWSIIYYAGHGMESNGTNYIIPADASLETDDDIPKQTVALDLILNAVSPAKQLRLVMLDACRDNPFVAEIHHHDQSGIIGPGLARIEPESGTLVAFATKHGHVATDGGSDNTPFATAVVKEMKTPGLEIAKFFRVVHDDVVIATKNMQEPFTYGQLPATEFYFREHLVQTSKIDIADKASYFFLGLVKFSIEVFARSRRLKCLPKRKNGSARVTG